MGRETGDHANYDFVSDAREPDELEYDFVKKEGEAANGAAEKPENEETSKKGASEQQKKGGKKT